MVQERSTLNGLQKKTVAVKPKAVVPPAAPTELTTSKNTTSSIQINWKDNATNETGYKLYRSTDGSHFSAIANLPAGAQSYLDKNLKAGTSYYYKVSAWDAGGEVISGATHTSTTRPLSAPTSVLVSGITSSSIALKWSDSSNSASGFRIYRSTNNSGYALVGNVSAGTFTFTDTGLSARTRYSYEVSAWNGTSDLKSKAVSATTLAAPPTAPTNLGFNSVTTTGVVLTWSDSSTNESGFHVYRSTDGVNYALLTSLPMNSTSFADSNLNSGTSYWYKVGAYGSTGEGLSAAASITTAMPVLQVATAPGGVSFSNVSSSSVTVNWTDSANATGYHIYRSTDATNYTLVGDLGATAASWTDTGVAAGTTYNYVIGAYNAAGESQTGALAVTTTVTAPGAPTDLGFSNITTTAATLNWTAPAGGGQTGYHVYRSTDGVNYTVVGNLGSNAISWTDSGLAPNTVYSYAVGAFNAGGEAQTAGTVVTTLAGAPSAPASISITNVTSSGVTLNWVAPGGQTGYNIYRSTDGVNFTAVGTASATATSWNDSGLSGSTSYVYELGAFNATGETRSAMAGVTTAAPQAPVTLSTQNMTSFSELVITGTTSADSIFVSESGSTLNILANGYSYSEPTSFGDLKIYGVSGNDTITVDSSVNIAALIYGGTGSDTIKNLTTAKATIVTIGGGTSTVTGNGINTAYWVNAGDIVHSTSAEVALGGVNRVSSFYQPFSSVSTNSNYIPATLLGQNLPDPTDSGAEKRLTNSSFFGTGPTMNDINQGGLADCYYVAPLASLAYSEPQKLMNMGVDLGDGTYAVRFMRNSVTTYVRVDGDLAAGYYNGGLANQQPGASGNQWGSIFEKAYAFFRTGANTYASLNWGSQVSTFFDLGFSSSAIGPAYSTAATVLSTINTQIAAGHAIAASTNGTITSGAPLIEAHVYTIIGAYKDSGGTVWIQLRNPWGVDGAGNDGNPYDGLVTISFATLQANFNSLNYTLA